MERTVSPYLEQPLRSLEEVLRQRAAGRSFVRGERGRLPVIVNIAPTSEDGPAPTLPWRIGLSLYSRR